MPIDNAESELDQLIRDILGSLGGEALADIQIFNHTLEVLGRLKLELSRNELLPRRFFGKLWLLSTCLSVEAWKLQAGQAEKVREAIREVFGPVVAPSRTSYLCPLCKEELSMTTQEVRRHYAKAHSRQLSPGEAFRLITPRSTPPDPGDPGASGRPAQGGLPSLGKRR